MTAATSLLVIAGCSTGADAPRQSVEVDGTVTLDGKPRVVTRCEVAPSGESVEVRLHLDGGAVVAYAEEARAVLVAGLRYRCTAGAARDIRWGTGAGGTFFHGGLSFACELDEATVTADLTLRCGVLDDATRQELEGAIEKARGE